MTKKIFIINGSGGVGKDTFIDFVSQLIPTINFSSVDKVKELAKTIGWTGSKDERNRRFLSDLKLLTTAYNDMPFRSMKEKVDEFNNSPKKLLFLHIREPKEIDRAVREFKANTILITRNSVKEITSNMADRNVANYKYDYVIDNNGTLAQLEEEVKKFIKQMEG